MDFSVIPVEAAPTAEIHGFIPDSRSSGNGGVVKGSNFFDHKDIVNVLRRLTKSAICGIFVCYSCRFLAVG